MYPPGFPSYTDFEKLRETEKLGTLYLAIGHIWDSLVQTTSELERHVSALRQQTLDDQAKVSRRIEAVENQLRLAGEG